jgi:peptidoglycan/LPS O-acetylase OafA/YrhL
MRTLELDGLRGISDHYMLRLPASGSQNGKLGVNLFFTLPGFLITNILVTLWNKEHCFFTFYQRWALRVFLPYFPGIAIYLGVSMLMGEPGTLHLLTLYIFHYTSTFWAPIVLYTSHKGTTAILLHSDRSNLLLSTVGLVMADMSFALVTFAVRRKSGSGASISITSTCMPYISQ